MSSRVPASELVPNVTHVAEGRLDATSEEHQAPHAPAPVEVPADALRALHRIYRARGAMEALARRQVLIRPLPSYRDVWCAAYDACNRLARVKRWPGGFGCYGCANCTAHVLKPPPLDAPDLVWRRKCPGPGANDPCMGDGHRQHQATRCRPCSSEHDRRYFRWVRCDVCNKRRKVPAADAEGWLCDACRPIAEQAVTRYGAGITA